MKKIFTLFAIGLTAVAAQAQFTTLQPQEAPARPTVRNAVASAVATEGATSSMDFGYCGEMYTCLNGGTAAAGGAFQLTTADAKRFDGAKITAILVAHPYLTKSHDISVFVSKTLNPANAITTTSATIGAATQTNYGEMEEYKLDEPVAIAAGQALYVGYTLTGLANGEYAYPIDYELTSNPSGFVGLGATVDALQWQSISGSYGSICMRCRIEGDNLPTDEGYIIDMWIPYMKQTTEGGEVEVLVKNNASNTITNVDLEVTVADQEPFVQNVTLESPIGFNQYSVGGLDFSYDVQGNNIPVTCKVVKVNGVDNKYTGTEISASQQFLNMNPGIGFDKNVVIEEGTGTWCGWCVRGIVALDKMMEEHPDGSFIPVAIHSGDDMACSGYSGVLAWISGFPGCVVNRNLMQYGVPSPLYATLNKIYEVERSVPAVGQIKITKVSDTSARVHKVFTECEFAFDDDAANYAIAVVATENGVGPYDQENYYSGGDAGAMDGWENKAETVEWTFSDVARGISSVWGSANSVPTTVEAGKTYSWSGNVSATFDGKDVRYVALLLNKATKRVENAFLYNPSAGILSVEADTAAGPAVYYDLNGRRVAEPTMPGLYLTNEGDKILVK